MRVRLQRSIAIAGIHHEAGKVYEVPDALAKELLGNGAAVPAGGPETIEHREPVVAHRDPVSPETRAPRPKKSVKRGPKGKRR
jgi:hypothetical protein